MKKSLLKLLRQWRKREAEFMSQATKFKPRIYELDQARYEGESVGTRWCCEDLEKLLKSTP